MTSQAIISHNRGKDAIAAAASRLLKASSGILVRLQLQFHHQLLLHLWPSIISSNSRGSNRTSKPSSPTSSTHLTAHQRQQQVSPRKMLFSREHICWLAFSRYLDLIPFPTLPLTLPRTRAPPHGISEASRNDAGIAQGKVYVGKIGHEGLDAGISNIIDTISRTGPSKITDTRGTETSMTSACSSTVVRYRKLIAARLQLWQGWLRWRRRLDGLRGMFQRRRGEGDKSSTMMKIDLRGLLGSTRWEILCQLTPTSQPVTQYLYSSKHQVSRSR